MGAMSGDDTPIMSMVFLQAAPSAREDLALLERPRSKMP